MHLITRTEILALLQEICNLMELSSIPYLVYGSVAYGLATEDQVEWNDIDIMVGESDFARLLAALRNPSFSLMPTQTPYSVHANSTVYEAVDHRPFDVSFDSFEHYFLELAIDLGDYEHKLERVRVAGQDAMMKIYERGLLGGNKEKADEYRRKLGVLSSLGV